MTAVILERDQLLGALDGLLKEAAAGPGRLVFVAGQAGVGKTALLNEFAARCVGRPDPIAVRRGNADNLTTPAGLGALVEALPELEPELEGSAAPPRPKLFRTVRAVLAATPSVVILEDLQWADRATLDLLVFIGRRLADLPGLIVATVRSDELDREHPVALLMGDLATAPGVVRLEVEPLTPAAVSQLVTDASSSIDPDQLFTGTGGNPFYVTEVLAAGGAALPASVRDAVAARISRRSVGARQVLAAAAVLGQRSTIELLSSVSGQPVSAVDECVEHGVLVGDDGGWSFRHEIARVAVAEAILPGEARALHARALTALRALDSDDDRRLALHAAAGGDRPATALYAERAGSRAARLGAHREAVEHYRTALRVTDSTAPQRIRLTEALSFECYLTDQLAEALTARQQALEHYQLAGDVRSMGSTQRWLSRLSWYLCRNGDAERYAAEAIATLESLGESGELAMAYSNLAQLRMLGDEMPEAVSVGRRAIAMARRVGDVDVEIHALNNVGTALAEHDDSMDGRRDLTRSLDMALARNAHEHAARAYTNLGSAAERHRRYADAERDLRAGIAYCTERDLDSWRLYMSGHLARSLADRGRLDEADEQARSVLDRQRVSPITRIEASVAAAQVRARRGLDVTDLLAEASRLADESREAQRLIPVASVRAEVAWLAGRTAEIGPALEPARIYAADSRVGHSWELGELSWWAHLGEIDWPATTSIAPPFALMLAGAWREAAAAWQERGSPWWAAIALSHAPDLESGREGVALLDQLGATATRDRMLRDRRARGLAVPRGPRASSDPASSLTAREMEVLELLVEGLTDAQIAERLVLSPKTVGHHVSAVLHKLDEPTRARAVAAAVRRGLLAPT